ncbi:transposase family protein [Streptomyces sp. NPDC087845]|uniref:transposase family protein n=1 Tax=Streptomyces sp. NPDC087845 TaxID=3365806 RepID=UPI0038107FF0
MWLWQDFRSRRSSQRDGRPVRGVGSLQLCSVEIASLLPQLVNVLVISADVSDAVVTVRARTRSGVPAGCTGCGQLSAWCHSRYVRHLADVTLGGRPLRIELSVRRLYCENPTCPKATFAEQVPGLTVRHQRRTPQLQRLVEAVGVVLAGRGGARMLRILNVTLSRLGLDRRTVRKYARARTWQEAMRRPPRKPPPWTPTSTTRNNAGTKDSTARRSCTRNSGPRAASATTSA